MAEVLGRRGAGDRRRGRMRRVFIIPLLVLAAVAIAACGSSSSSSSSSGGSASSSSSSSSSSAAQPGKGKPPITLGTTDFTEEFIIGALYQQVLQHAGYTVNYKPNIGATEIVDKALTSGQIDAYPEYTGESTATVFKINTPVSSPEQEYQLAKAAYAKRGQTMSNITPFFDADGIATLKTYATKHGLVTMTDLKKLPHFTLGARPEFQGRQQGAAGMKSAYGINNFTFKSLALGIQYQALDSNNVDTADIFTTDPQLASGKYTVLTDPKHIFGYQNIALVIDTKKLNQLGGATFMALINKVNSLLTTPAVIAMNKAVAIDKQQPATVAQSFLKANGLL
jgi:glycine betaine/choline ABC-type transport system substrate-binding protein